VLFETGLNLRPRPLVTRVSLKVGEPGVEQGTLLGCHWDVFIQKGIPKGRNELETVARTQSAGFFQQVRAHAGSISPSAARASNVSKLSGERSEAERVR
jgi:hypothetical protein